MTQVHAGVSWRTIRPLQIAIVLLVVITALIHLDVGIGMMIDGPPGGGQGRSSEGARGGFSIVRMLPLPLPILFVLNGIGYLVLVVALYLAPLYQYQHAVRWTLIFYTAVTIILYFVIVGLRAHPTGLVDKMVEAALIVFLLIEDRQPTASRQPRPASVGMSLREAGHRARTTEATSGRT